tara:strand:+ start:822 stop:1034 length:213 start_codon:yes stop_codon:yes gene_type:complete
MVDETVEQEKMAILEKMLAHFDASKSNETRHNGSPSNGDVEATIFMRKFYENQLEQMNQGCCDHCRRYVG